MCFAEFRVNFERRQFHSPPVKELERELRLAQGNARLLAIARITDIVYEC